MLKFLLFFFLVKKRVIAFSEQSHITNTYQCTNVRYALDNKKTKGKRAILKITASLNCLLFK